MVNGNIRRWLEQTAAAALAALLTLGLAAPASANPSTYLQITATVQRVLRLQVIARPATIRVSEADIARGYVEVEAPMQLAVRSNAVGGYVLAFENQGEFLRQAHIRGLANPVVVGAGGGVVPQRSAAMGMTSQNLSLQFRFDLGAGVEPGTYPWPLRVSVEPL